MLDVGFRVEASAHSLGASRSHRRRCCRDPAKATNRGPTGPGPPQRSQRQRPLSLSGVDGEELGPSASLLDCPVRLDQFDPSVARIAICAPATLYLLTLLSVVKTSLRCVDAYNPTTADQG